MKKPIGMSPMKAMMGIKRSASPSARILKRASGAIKKASSSIMSIPKPSQFMKRIAPAVPMMKKKFGEGISGPKLRLDDVKTNMPNMNTAHSTPAIKAPTAPVSTPSTKKMSSKALKRAAAAAKTTTTTK
jgi:hypothetical protein